MIKQRLVERDRPASWVGLPEIRMVKIRRDQAVRLNVPTGDIEIAMTKIMSEPHRLKDADR